MKCPKCGHDYRGKVCPDCGYPEHQLRSGGASSFIGARSASASPRPNNRTRHTSSTSSPSKNASPMPWTAVPPASRNAWKKTALRRERAASGRGRGCLIAIVVTIILIVLLGVLAQMVYQAADPTPEAAAPESYLPEAENDLMYSFVGDEWSDLDEEDAAALSEAGQDLAVQLEDSYGYWDGGEYYISGDDYGLFVSLWNDSLVTLCKEAAGGDQDALDQWETIVSDLRALSADSYQSLESYGLEAMNVDIVISGQEDMDLYLIVSNGEITYDYTRDGAL